MAELPTGTVTFLFTDIQGSTSMWERDARMMQAALARHDEPTEGEAGSESSSGWNDLIGWIEEQGEEDTQGFMKRHRN